MRGGLVGENWLKEALPLAAGGLHRRFLKIDLVLVLCRVPHW